MKLNCFKLIPVHKVSVLCSGQNIRKFSGKKTTFHVAPPWDRSLESPWFPAHSLKEVTVFQHENSRGWFISEIISCNTLVLAELSQICQKSPWKA